ncbi:hypothetical protein ACFLWK_00230 [Chloroflexota bacterium]
MKMIDRNTDYNILVEAEAVAATYSRLKPADMNISDIEWMVASDETKLLLIHTQQLAKYLGEVYLEAEETGNHGQAALLYQVLNNRPCLSSIDPNINDLYECIEREVQFTASTRSWIKEVQTLVYQDFPQK